MDDADDTELQSDPTTDGVLEKDPSSESSPSDDDTLDDGLVEAHCIVCILLLAQELVVRFSAFNL